MGSDAIGGKRDYDKKTLPITHGAQRAQRAWGQSSSGRMRGARSQVSVRQVVIMIWLIGACGCKCVVYLTALSVFGFFFLNLRFINKELQV